MLRLYSICFFGGIFLFLSIHAQETQKLYMITLPDKGNLSEQIIPVFSKKAQERRAKHGISILDSLDYPVYRPYIDSLKARSFRVIYTSRWLNSALIMTATEAKPPEVSLSGKPLPVKYLGKWAPPTTPEPFETEFAPATKKCQGLKEIYSASYPWLEALGAVKLKQQGFDGSGITIAVLDAGFLGIKHHRAFQSARIIYTFDWVNGQTNVYTSDSHGAEVLGCMAASDSGNILGMSVGAQYILMRTEQSQHEFEYEEFLWTLAAECADSLGTDMICSSLGYNYFDEGNSHEFEALDGNTTLIARAAGIAAKKGIWVFVSAGNEGNDTWKHITTPADAHGVTVTGATTFSGSETYFSSVGPTADRRTSPQLGAPGVSIYTVHPQTGRYSYKNGSSYSNPLICGLAASLMQKFPKLPYPKLQELLYKSAKQYPKTDPYQGYGWPNFDAIDTGCSALQPAITLLNSISKGDTVYLSFGVRIGATGNIEISAGKTNHLREKITILENTEALISLKAVNRKKDTEWHILWRGHGEKAQTIAEIDLRNKSYKP